MKISSEKRPEQLSYRAPVIKVLSKTHSINDVDYWHVGPKQQPRAICRSVSHLTIQRVPMPMVGPGESFQNHRVSTSSVPVIEATHIPTQQSLRPNLAEPIKDKGTTQGTILLKPNELAAIVADTVTDTLNKNQQSVATTSKKAL